MREIKFRAWDVKFEKMYYSHGECDECCRVQLFHGDWEIATIFPSGDDAGDIACDGKKAILMEFTGLKDKNGVEIYESDLVLIRGKTTATVVYDRAGFYTYRVKDDGRYRLDGWFDGYLEVIGNIYENPELLNDKY